MNKTDYVIAGLVVVTATILGVLIFISQDNSSSSDDDYNSFDQSAAFNFEYPERWVADIPEANQIVSGPPATVRQDVPGPSFSIVRAVAGLGDNLMEGYLETRLLREGSPQDWELLTDIVDVTIDDTYNAQMIEAVGTLLPGAPVLHTRHFTFRADNNIVYVIVMSAPEDDWEELLPTFEYMLDSVTINE